MLPVQGAPAGFWGLSKGSRGGGFLCRRLLYSSVNAASPVQVTRGFRGPGTVLQADSVAHAACSVVMR